MRSWRFDAIKCVHFPLSGAFANNSTFKARFCSTIPLSKNHFLKNANIAFFCVQIASRLCSPNTSQTNDGSEVIEQKRLNEPLKRQPNGCTPNRYLFSLNIKNTHRFESEMAPRALHAILERFSPYHGAFF